MTVRLCSVACAVANNKPMGKQINTQMDLRDIPHEQHTHGVHEQRTPDDFLLKVRVAICHPRQPLSRLAPSNLALHAAICQRAHGCLICAVEHEPRAHERAVDVRRRGS